MDVDGVDEQLQPLSQHQSGKPVIVPIDDAHPFDLEGYITSYTGRTAIDRLTHIVRLCPTIAPEAFGLAIEHIQKARDPALYQTLINEYAQLLVNPQVHENFRLPSLSEIRKLDPKWLEELSARNQSERMKLEVELKTYTNNMIKESIRMAHRDLGEFYRLTGDYTLSLKHHTKSREFCTTSQHVLDMCLSILELLIEQRNYAHLSTYVFKAEAALDASATQGANGAGNSTASTSTPAPGAGTGASISGGPTSATGNKKAKQPTERETVQARLELATALSHLGQGNFEKAAQSFLKVGPMRELRDWIGTVVSASDIAIYGTLCALASMSRSAVKTQLLNNPVFGLYIEQEPYIRELLEAYINSNFRTALELLSKYSTRHYIDIHLSPHVSELMNLIKNKAIVLYFQPFASIKLDRMSEAFGWTVDIVEQNVIALIHLGEIQGRVDSQNKILYSKKTDYRAELFARTIQAGRDIISANRKVLLRMRLQQAGLIVKPPKNQQSQGYDVASELYME